MGGNLITMASSTPNIATSQKWKFNTFKLGLYIGNDIIGSCTSSVCLHVHTNIDPILLTQICNVWLLSEQKPAYVVVHQLNFILLPHAE